MPHPSPNFNPDGEKREKKTEDLRLETREQETEEDEVRNRDRQHLLSLEVGY